MSTPKLLKITQDNLNTLFNSSDAKTTVTGEKYKGKYGGGENF